MYYYMDEEQYQNAYEIACIGVTSSDWNYLGNKTLKKLQLQLSAKAFSHTRNYRMLVLINDLIKMKTSGARKRLFCDTRVTEGFLENNSYSRSCSDEI